MKLSTLRKIDALLQAAADEAHLQVRAAGEAWSRAMDDEDQMIHEEMVAAAERLRDAQEAAAELDEALEDWEVHEWR